MLQLKWIHLVGRSAAPVKDCVTAKGSRLIVMQGHLSSFEVIQANACLSVNGPFSSGGTLRRFPALVYEMHPLPQIPSRWDVAAAKLQRVFVSL